MGIYLKKIAADPPWYSITVSQIYVSLPVLSRQLSCSVIITLAQYCGATEVEVDRKSVERYKCYSR